MKKLTRSQALETIVNRAVNPSKFSIRSGVVTVKVGYFYRHGGSPEKLSARIAKVVPGYQEIETHDDWQAWPKDSYFVVKFTSTATDDEIRAAVTPVSQPAADAIISLPSPVVTEPVNEVLEERCPNCTDTLPCADCAGAPDMGVYPSLTEAEAQRFEELMEEGIREDEAYRQQEIRDEDKSANVLPDPLDLLHEYLDWKGSQAVPSGMYIIVSGPYPSRRAAHKLVSDKVAQRVVKNAEGEYFIIWL